MKRRMRNRTYGVVGGDGLYPVTYPIYRKLDAVNLLGVTREDFKADRH